MEEKIVNYLREYKDILNKKSLEEKNIYLFEKYINKVGDIINIIDSLEYKSKADKMFKELGYTKFFQNSIDVRYSNESNEIIAFYGAVKTFEKVTYPVNMQELQAINEKVKELGWNE